MDFQIYNTLHITDFTLQWLKAKIFFAFLQILKATTI